MALSEKQLAGNQRRTLRAMRVKLLNMADEWEGVDEYARTELTELADKAETVAVALTQDEH